MIRIKAKAEGDTSSPRTCPKMSNGNPTKVSKLFRSEVFRELGRVNVGALAAKGGDPQSSSVCMRQGMSDINEY